MIISTIYRPVHRTGTGGQFAKKAAVSEETPEESNAYAVEKERRIQAFADRLEKSEELLEFAVSVLLVLPTKGKSLEGANILHQISKLPKKQIFRKLAEEIDQHSETISHLLERKGAPQKPHVNKYAEKSQTESQIRQRATEAEQRLSAKNAKAFGNIRLRSSLQEHEAAGGHMIERHGARSNEGLAKRFEEENAPETSSCFESDRVMEESAEKAIEENQKSIHDWLTNPRIKKDLEIDVRMGKNIGRSMRKKDLKVTSKKEAKFILRKNARMAEGFNFATGFPI